MDDLMSAFSRILADGATIVGAGCVSRRTSAASSSAHPLIGNNSNNNFLKNNNSSSFFNRGSPYYRSTAGSFLSTSTAPTPTTLRRVNSARRARSVSNNSSGGKSYTVISRITSMTDPADDTTDGAACDDEANTDVTDGYDDVSTAESAIGRLLGDGGGDNNLGKRGMSARSSSSLFSRVLRRNDVVKFEIPRRRPPPSWYERASYRLFTRPILVEKLNAEVYREVKPSISNSEFFSDAPDAPPLLQFRAKFDSRRSMLIVHVVCAKNLPAMDLNGFSDPYVKIYLHCEQTGGVSYCGVHQTRVYYKTLNPVFNEAFEIPLMTKDPALLANVILRLWVYDFDFLTRDDLIGCVTVPDIFQRLTGSPSSFIVFREVIDRNVKEDAVGGEILVDLEMLPLTGRININIIRLRNIAAPGITCTEDDWYFAKLDMMYSPPGKAGARHHFVSSKDKTVISKRTRRCQAEMRFLDDCNGKSGSGATSSRGRALSGMPDVKTSAGWLEVNFNEHFNFSLKSSAKNAKSTESNNNSRQPPSPTEGTNLVDATDVENNINNNSNNAITAKRFDYKLKISVYVQKGKSHNSEDATVSPSGDCGIVQSILQSSIKHNIGSCTIGTSINGMGGEHWAEAERAALSSRNNFSDTSHATITRWHSLILGKGGDAGSVNSRTNSDEQN